MYRQNILQSNAVRSRKTRISTSWLVRTAGWKCPIYGSPDRHVHQWLGQLAVLWHKTAQIMNHICPLSSYDARVQNSYNFSFWVTMTCCLVVSTSGPLSIITNSRYLNSKIWNLASTVYFAKKWFSFSLSIYHCPLPQGQDSEDPRDNYNYYLDWNANSIAIRRLDTRGSQSG